MKHKALYVTTALSLILAIACASLYLKMRACQQECRSLSQEKAYKALLVSYDDFAKARKINQMLGGSAEYVVDIDALKIESKIFSM